MSVIVWIVLGLIAGFIASKLVNHKGEGFLLDIVLGVAGAMVGGWIMAAFGGQGVTGFNGYSMLVAIEAPSCFWLGTTQSEVRGLPDRPNRVLSRLLASVLLRRRRHAPSHGAGGIDC